MTNRKDILESAIAHTCGERDVEYGSPQKNMQDIAALWNAYITQKYGVRNDFTSNLQAEDVALMMNLLKVARTMSGAVKPDTYEDAAAYAAIAGECTLPEDFDEDPHGWLEEATPTSSGHFIVQLKDTMMCAKCDKTWFNDQSIPSNEICPER